MRWSFKLGRFAGIDVFLHPTFFLLIPYVLLSHTARGDDAFAALEGLLFVLSIFFCVVLHEYGHALTARRFGIRTRDITLLPIGGVARLERMPADPRQELLVALAGPAVNVVIATAILPILLLTGGLVPVEELGPSGGPFLERLMLVNVFLVIFNLIPAFPMDGGRVLRALLALVMDYVRATRIAATVGQAMAFVLAWAGLFVLENPMLLLIAVFVWIGAGAEANQTAIRSALAGIPVSHAVLTDFRALSPRSTLGDAVELVLAGSQTDFPVMEDGRVVGVLTRQALMVGLAEQGRHAPVAATMRTDFEVADASETLERALERVADPGSCPVVPVVRAGRLVGLLTPENAGEFMMIQGALRGRVRD